jgi:hypothetical protein
MMNGAAPGASEMSGRLWRAITEILLLVGVLPPPSSLPIYQEF